MIKAINKKKKENPTIIDECKYNGVSCLIKYMKIFPNQTMCQNCELQLGLIKEERQHFHKRDIYGRYYSGMCRGKWTIWQLIKIRLTKQQKYVNKIKNSESLQKEPKDRTKSWETLETKFGDCILG